MPMLALARILLAPLLLWQERQVRRRVPKLPEASGARLGLIGSDHAGHAVPRLRLLIQMPRSTRSKSRDKHSTHCVSETASPPFRLQNGA